jgi:hypothetical protein
MSEKLIFISPSTSKLEEILFQFSKLCDGKHRTYEDYVINLEKQEQNFFGRLDEFKNQQIKLLQKQRDC